MMKILMMVVAAAGLSMSVGCSKQETVPAPAPEAPAEAAPAAAAPAAPAAPAPAAQ